MPEYVGGSTVELIDVMGNDMRVVHAARVSYDMVSKGEEADRKLIRFLLEHNHMSPFEQPHLTYRINAPVFCWRQIMRHRMANYNEVSARYTVVSEEFYLPEEWRAQDNTNRQSSVSSEEMRVQKEMLDKIYKDSIESALEAYNGLLFYGVAREQARMVLPLSMMSKVIMTVDLRSLMNILSQRLHPGAQKETQDIAREMMRLAEEHFPWTFQAAREVGKLGTDH